MQRCRFVSTKSTESRAFQLQRPMKQWSVTVDYLLFTALVLNNRLVFLISVPSSNLDLFLLQPVSLQKRRKLSGSTMLQLDDAYLLWYFVMSGYHTAYRTSGLATKARFPLSELTARVNGPSWRVTRFPSPRPRLVETGLKLASFLSVLIAR